MNIPAEDIEHIFDGFLQLDAFANGTGISMTAFAFRNGRIYDCCLALKNVESKTTFFRARH